MNKSKLLMTAALALALGATGAVAQEQGGRGGPGHAGPAASGMHASPGGQLGGASPGGAAMHNNAAHNAPAGPVRNGGAGTMQPNRNAGNASVPTNRNAGQMPQPHRQVGQMEQHRQVGQAQPHGNAGQISREHGRVETTGQASHEERRGVVEQRGGARITNDREINERSRAIGEGLRGKEPTTTGQGAASAHGAVNLTPEQRTRLHEIFAGAHGPRLGGADFDLAVGHKVPRSVRFVAVPEAVYAIEPAWRDYDYFEVADQIVIVDPVTLEIIAVIDV
jgi:hypothetical protein